MIRKINQALMRGGDWITELMPEWFTDSKCLFVIMLCGFWLLVTVL